MSLDPVQSAAVQMLLQAQVEQRMKLERVIASMDAAQKAMEQKREEEDAEARLIAQTEALQKQATVAPVATVAPPPLPEPQYPANFEAVVSVIAERVAERVAITRIREHMAQVVSPTTTQLPPASPPPVATAPYLPPVPPPAAPTFLNYNPNAGTQHPTWPWRR